MSISLEQQTAETATHTHTHTETVYTLEILFPDRAVRAALAYFSKRPSHTDRKHPIFITSAPLTSHTERLTDVLCLLSNFIPFADVKLKQKKCEH